MFVVTKMSNAVTQVHVVEIVIDGKRIIPNREWFTPQFWEYVSSNEGHQGLTSGEASGSSSSSSTQVNTPNASVSSEKKNHPAEKRSGSSEDNRVGKLQKLESCNVSQSDHTILSSSSKEEDHAKEHKSEPSSSSQHKDQGEEQGPKSSTMHEDEEYANGPKSELLPSSNHKGRTKSKAKTCTPSASSSSSSSKKGSCESSSSNPEGLVPQPHSAVENATVNWFNETESALSEDIRRLLCVEKILGGERIYLPKHTEPPSSIESFVALDVLQACVKCLPASDFEFRVDALCREYVPWRTHMNFGDDQTFARFIFQEYERKLGEFRTCSVSLDKSSKDGRAWRMECSGKGHPRPKPAEPEPGKIQRDRASYKVGCKRAARLTPKGFSFRSEHHENCKSKAPPKKKSHTAGTQKGKSACSEETSLDDPVDESIDDPLDD